MAPSSLLPRLLPISMAFMTCHTSISPSVRFAAWAWAIKVVSNQGVGNQGGGQFEERHICTNTELYITSIISDLTQRPPSASSHPTLASPSLYEANKRSVRSINRARSFGAKESSNKNVLLRYFLHAPY